MTAEDISVSTLDQLQRSKLLQGLDPMELSTVVRVARPRTVERGSFFFQQGEAAVALYLLMHGQVRLTQMTPEGNQTLLRFLGPAEMLGVVAVFGQDT